MKVRYVLGGILALLTAPLVAGAGGEFYRSSEIQFDGERAPRTTRFEFRGLPGGKYAVAAVLKGANSERLASTQREINVVESLLAR